MGNNKEIAKIFRDIFALAENRDLESVNEMMDITTENNLSYRDILQVIKCVMHIEESVNVLYYYIKGLCLLIDENFIKFLDACIPNAFYWNKLYPYMLKI